MLKFVMQHKRLLWCWRRLTFYLVDFDHRLLFCAYLASFTFFFLFLNKLPSSPASSVPLMIPHTPILSFLRCSLPGETVPWQQSWLVSYFQLSGFINICSTERMMSAVTVVVMQKPDGTCRSLHGTPFLCKNRVTLHCSRQGCFGFVQS